MARLIDADALYEEHTRLAYEGDYAFHITARAWLEKAPTVDAVPVVHGRWQGVSPFVDSLECSECRYCITDEEFKTPYCPWCGAKMDGERKGGDE